AWNDGAGLMHHSIEYPVVYRAFDQKARSCRTDLTLAIKDSPCSRRSGRVEIGVGEYDIGRLAAKFGLKPLVVHRGGGPDLLAGSGAAGERDAPDERCFGEEAPDFPSPGNDIDHSGRKACFTGLFGQKDGG